VIGGLNVFEGRIHTRCCIDTIDSPDDEHEVARNMSGIEINT
jgi:hypothetical protein